MMPSVSCLHNIKIDADFLALLKNETFHLPAKDLENSDSDLFLKEKIKLASLISIGTVSFHILLVMVFLWTAFHKADAETPVQVIEVNMVTLSSSEEQNNLDSSSPSVSEPVPPVIESAPEPVVPEPEPVSEPVPDPVPEVKSEIPPVAPIVPPVIPPVAEKPKPKPAKPKPVDVKKLKDPVKKPAQQEKQNVPQTDLPLNKAQPSPNLSTVTNNQPTNQGDSVKSTSSAQSSGGITTGVKNVYNPRPSYPASARRRGDEGTVYVRLLIGKNGQIASVALHKSSGFDSLDSAALEGVQSWRFSPALKNGEPIEKSVILPVRFQLEESSD